VALSGAAASRGRQVEPAAPAGERLAFSSKFARLDAAAAGLLCCGVVRKGEGCTRCRGRGLRGGVVLVDPPACVLLVCTCLCLFVYV
jgi:hypothetical protein